MSYHTQVSQWVGGWVGERTEVAGADAHPSPLKFID